MLSNFVEQAVAILSQSVDLHVILIIVSTIFIVIIDNKINKHRQLPTTLSRKSPPRLRSLPIIGSIPFLPAEFEKLHYFFMEKLSMGPVLGFNTFSRYIVVLQTREAIAEAFAKAEISNHPNSAYDVILSEEKRKGFIIFMPYGTDFKQLHQLILKVFKQFDFGRMGGITEARIQEEVAHLVSELKVTEKQPIDPTQLIDLGILNVIVSILFGKRFGKNDSLAHEVLTKSHEALSTTVSTFQMTVIPVLQYLPQSKHTLKAMKAINEWFDDYCDTKITECERDQEKTPSFIRSYIEAEGKETYDRVKLRTTVMVLMLGGSHTVATSIMWFIAVLANNPDVQLRLQTEIDNCVPRQRLPSLSERQQLILVEATVLEMMRFKAIGPLGLPHGTTTDTLIQGFHIPANTIVIPNFHAVHMSPSVWGDPERFRPDRFINQHGNIIKREYVIPFSIGKRSCLGEKLARDELFLFLAGLMQNFTILPPEGCETIDCEGMAVNGNHAPSAYKVRFIPRDDSSE